MINRINAKDILIFTRQLSILIKSGIPILESIRIIFDQNHHSSFNKILKEIIFSLKNGSLLSESLAKHPHVFNIFYIGIVQVGEKSGILATALEKLADFQERRTILMSKIKSALVYPIIVIITTIIIIGLLIFSVVPKFNQIFTETLQKQDIPTFTQFIFDSSAFCQKNEYLILFGLPFLAILILSFFFTPSGQKMRDTLLIKIPLIKKFTLKIVIARFCGLSGLLLKNDIPILTSLKITQFSIQNQYISVAINSISSSLEEGENLFYSMKKTGIFSPMILSMIEVGEKTGKLADMLLNVSSIYENEINETITRATTLIEPIMILLLAVIIFFTIIALFMPLMSIMNAIQ